MSSTMLLNSHAVEPCQSGFQSELNRFHEFFRCDPSVEKRVLQCLVAGTVLVQVAAAASNALEGFPKGSLTGPQAD